MFVKSHYVHELYNPIFARKTVYPIYGNTTSRAQNIYSDTNEVQECALS